MTVRHIIKQSGVTLICTTDDPVDSLEWHKKIAEDDSFDVQVLPAWRPDKATNIEKPTYAAYIAQLAEVSGVAIDGFAPLKEAIKNRMAFFDSMGCKVSDHGVEFVMYAPASDEEVDAIMKKRLAGEAVSREEELKYKTAFCSLWLRNTTVLAGSCSSTTAASATTTPTCSRSLDRTPALTASTTMPPAHSLPIS